LTSCLRTPEFSREKRSAGSRKRRSIISSGSIAKTSFYRAARIAVADRWRIDHYVVVLDSRQRHSESNRLFGDRFI
jgi:hypothetical protein